MTGKSSISKTFETNRYFIRLRDRYYDPLCIFVVLFFLKYFVDLLVPLLHLFVHVVFDTNATKNGHTVKVVHYVPCNYSLDINNTQVAFNTI